MALNYGPSIVKDGLVLALNAADVNSYPGSGNTWYDVSGNGNNATKNGNAANPTWFNDANNQSHRWLCHSEAKK
jgi:hypothetical protein